MKKHFIVKGILFAILGVAAVIGFSYLVMLLWNWLIPSLFGGPVVDIWKAAGLLLLSKIFFSGFGKGCRKCRRSRARHWKEKWTNLSPEDKAKLKSKWKCWGDSVCSDSESKPE